MLSDHDKMLKGVLNDEGGILRGSNTRYCGSVQSRKSVDLLPQLKIGDLKISAEI
jgi:hypothetical protein